MSDESISKGKEWLEELLQLMGLPAVVEAKSVEDSHSDSTSYWLTIDGGNLSMEEIELLIGTKGENIDAIQYLANALLHLQAKGESQGYYTIELDGYRARREAELFALAEKLAEQVRETGEPREVSSLSSAERRQIHSFLQDAGDITTESIGQEPDRRLIVKLK
jgi:spoIIIJ-associated protein